MSALAQAFHGSDPAGEGNVPGTGGNLQTVYEGWGSQEAPQPGYDEGYDTGHFPAGRIPTGTEQQEFRISDSTAFNNLRGVAKTSYPFDPFPAQDHPNLQATSLTDNFQQSDVSGISSLMPGKFSYDSHQSMLGKEILEEMKAGTSTYNSLPWAETPHASGNADMMKQNGRRFASNSNYSTLTAMGQEGDAPQSIVEQYRQSFTTPVDQDVPLTPFHKTYPNFGSGKVDYGFEEPGADTASAEILKAYSAVLPEGQLAGTKKDLMPVFSGVNHDAVEQRPILQSLGKLKNTLYLGGVIELPDELRIDPRQSLKEWGNIPTGVEQTAGELASALDTLGYFSNANGINTSNPYGQPMQGSRTLAGSSQQPSASFYSPPGYFSNEPLVFGSGEGFEQTGSEANELLY